MRYILVITSSTNNEFQGWKDGNHGQESKDGAYLVTGKNGHITVIDGEKLDNPSKKATEVLQWIGSKIDSGIAPSDMALMVHGQKDELGKVVKICCAKGTNLSGVSRDYYTSTKRNWNQYRLIEQFWKKGSHTDKLVNSLVAWCWKETPEQKSEEACRLRAEILTPLVARDLIEQAIDSKRVKSDDVSRDLRKQIDEAVRDLDNPVQEFCTLASINCKDFREKLAELRKQCGASSGDQSWKTFHTELKDVAEKMETQIQAIGG